MLNSDQKRTSRGGDYCAQEKVSQVCVVFAVFHETFRLLDARGLAYCNGIIRNNTITPNTAQRHGGGLRHCDGTIRDNIISGNSAERNGGGVRRCHGTIQNNIIVGNSAGNVGGGLFECQSTIRNCIILENRAPEKAQRI